MKKRSFHSGFAVRKKLFQRGLKSWKKVVYTVKKEAFSWCFYGEKKVFDLSFHGGFSIVKTKNVSQRLKVSTVQVTTMFVKRLSR